MEQVTYEDILDIFLQVPGHVNPWDQVCVVDEMMELGHEESFDTKKWDRLA